MKQIKKYNKNDMILQTNTAYTINSRRKKNYDIGELWERDLKDSGALTETDCGLLFDHMCFM